MPIVGGTPWMSYEQAARMNAAMDLERGRKSNREPDKCEECGTTGGEERTDRHGNKYINKMWNITRYDSNDNPDGTKNVCERCYLGYRHR